MTVELSDETYARLLDRARRVGVPIATVLVQLVGGALGSDTHEAVSPEDHASQYATEVRRAREILGDLVEPSRQDRVPMSPSLAEAARRSLPVLDPPLSQTIVEGREDRA